MRLIDADKLEPHEIHDDNGFTEVVYMDDIREMPTIKIVQCKYCIHKDRVSDYCMYLKREVKREDFCCLGGYRNDICKMEY